MLLGDDVDNVGIAEGIPARKIWIKIIDKLSFKNFVVVYDFIHGNGLRIGISMTWILIPRVGSGVVPSGHRVESRVLPCYRIPRLP